MNILIKKDVRCYKTVWNNLFKSPHKIVAMHSFFKKYPIINLKWELWSKGGNHDLENLVTIKMKERSKVEETEVGQVDTGKKNCGRMVYEGDGPIQDV